MDTNDDMKAKAEDLQNKAAQMGHAATEKATELGATATAKATELGSTATAKASELGATAAAKATELGATATSKAGALTEQVQAVVSDLAEKHGPKVTGAVHAATEFVDAKSGGKTAVVSDKVNAATQSAVQSLQPEDEQSAPKDDA